MTGVLFPDPGMAAESSPFLPLFIYSADRGFLLLALTSNIVFLIKGNMILKLTGISSTISMMNAAKAEARLRFLHTASFANDCKTILTAPNSFSNISPAAGVTKKDGGSDLTRLSSSSLIWSGRLGGAVHWPMVEGEKNATPKISIQRPNREEKRLQQASRLQS